MESRCRLCAESSAELVHVFEDMHYLELPARVMDLFKVKIAIEDELPTAVCFFCCDMVEKIWSFGERVQKSQELLFQLANAAVPVDIDFVDSKEIETCMVTEAIQQQQNVPSVPPPPPTHQQVMQAEIFEEDDLSLKEDMPVEKPPSPILEDTENKTYKSKSRKAARKRSGHGGAAAATAATEETLAELDGAEVNEDGSVLPKQEVVGWEAYPWVCCECRQTLPSSEDLREHCATAHGQAARYGCADCAKVYAKYSVFLGHARVHRAHLRFSCDVCHKWFLTVDSQDRHRAHHADERPHACATCGKRFRMQSALMVHARSHLPVELKNRHQCDQCPKRFGTKPNLMAHKRIHAGVRDYTCDQCGKSFVQKGNLDNHLLTHTAVRPFTCGVCGKSFKTHVRLRKHGSVHSGLKPHQCDVCGRQFRERGTLKEHHRIHTGAMPFTCEFCGKSFRFKGVLTTHRRQHTGERPYSCYECQHHFTNWPNYNKHMKRRHGINTSVTVRKPQTIPPTGMPHRNPPGTVLAPPQPIAVPETFVDGGNAFYPVLNLYNLSEELLQQRV